MLTRLPVRLAMRRNPLRLSMDQNLNQAVSSMIKYKVSSVLIYDDKGDQDQGLLTKTDLMTLYYGQLPLDTLLQDVLVAPIVTCVQDDYLEVVMSRMLDQKVNRIYVLAGEGGRIIGVLSFADIVGLLYRICSKCNKSLTRSGQDRQSVVLQVRDVMHYDVVTCEGEQTIAQALEILSMQSLSALLVQGGPDRLPGVVSKSDLIMAYRHNVPLKDKIKEISSYPALSCARDEPLTQVLGRMMIANVHRLFVHGPDPSEVQGVLSLTDAARARSGSCRACSASRLT